MHLEDLLKEKKESPLKNHKMKLHDTHHARPDRSSESEVRMDFSLFMYQDFFEQIFNSLPYIITVLNENRQVVFTNSKVLEQFNIDDLSNVLGKRPGEFINCIHSADLPAGCGTSKNCKVCGAVNTILGSISTNKKVKNECRITTRKNGSEISLDFEVNATPFKFKGRNFTVFSMIDISNEKRRRVLERIFFHDILNTAGNIAGLIEIINDTTTEEDSKKLFKIVSGLSKEIIDEINSQRVLLLAESGELNLNLSTIDLLSLLEAIKNEFMLVQNNNCEIIIQFPKEGLSLNTDRIILTRILKNMVKNAIEASSTFESVLMTVEKKHAFVRFTVYNPSYIPIESQLQIFKKNFSTKGFDRGLGTYSMKLLGETYLKGKLSFKSKKDEGTYFYFDHPVDK